MFYSGLREILQGAYFNRKTQVTAAGVTWKHGMYELPQELPNDLRLKKLGNIRRVLKLLRIIA